MSARLPPALLAVSHGTSSLPGQAAVTKLVDAVASGCPVPVVPGHVDVQQPDVPAALSSVAAGRPVVIVPLLLSAGFHVHVDLVHEASIDDRDVRVARALGPDDRLVRVLARRLGQAGLRREDAVVLGCAGSSDARAVDDCREMARRLGVVLHRPVTVGFISAAEPSLPDAIAAARRVGQGSRVVVSTYLLAPGYFNDLLHTMAAALVTDPLLVEDAASPPEIVSIVLDRYAEAAPFAASICAPHTAQGRVSRTLQLGNRRETPTGSRKCSTISTDDKRSKGS